jgi:PAS domain S-box-containing protein
MDSEGTHSIQEFLESMPDACLAIDSSGAIQFVNTQAEMLFGYEPNELLGQPVEVLVPQRVREKHPHHRALFYLEPTKRPMGIGLELSAVRKTGVEFPCDISLSPIHRDGRVLVIAAVRDQSDRRRYETMFVTALTEQVANLSKSVDSAREAFEKEKEVVRKKRNKDRAVVAALSVLGFTLIGSLLYTQHGLQSAKDARKELIRVNCEQDNVQYAKQLALWNGLIAISRTSGADQGTPEQQKAFQNIINNTFKQKDCGDQPQ